MLKLIKELIESYKDYKLEKAQDKAEVDKILANRRVKFNEEVEKELAEDDMIVEKNTTYNEKKKLYQFSIVVKHNGVPKTYSCESKNENSCKTTASFVMNEARLYEAWGDM